MKSPTVCTAANSQNRALSLLLPSSPTIQASLLANAVNQLASMLEVPPSSRASPLPQGSMPYANAAYTRDLLWERACSRKRWVSLK